ncbi:uncharacterized protein LOC141690603 [Apium graveolens]|uniref:uncharacterized protein LOC141690603 n=1 Tax=Apium graveolens TaxID=4045 RepID=UPI003D7B380D
MAMCLEATNLSRIYDGPHKPMKLVVAVAGQEEKMDAKVKHILHSSLDSVMSNRVIGCKIAKEIWDTLEVKCQGNTTIKKNRRTLLIQEYEHFDSRSDESFSEIYDRFQKLINDMSLVDKEYDLEEYNLKFLLALPEKWDLKVTLIRDNYKLDDVSLDEIYGKLKTRELEMEQGNKRKGPRARHVALKVEEKPKEKARKKGHSKGKAMIAKLIEKNLNIIVTFVYAFNDAIDRVPLWDYILSTSNSPTPWAFLGDFNCITSLNEVLGGREHWTPAMQSFKDCLFNSGLEPMRTIGDIFTWFNKRSHDPVYKRLDRMVANSAWFNIYTEGNVFVKHRGIMDHNPLLFEEPIQLQKLVNWNRGKILSLQNTDGNLVYGQEPCASVAVQYFTQLLGAPANSDSIDLSSVNCKEISDAQSRLLVASVTDTINFDTIKTMKKNKAPGPDGVNAEFFLATWHITGASFCAAVRYFFDHGLMPSGELFRGYERETGVPKCALMIDLYKAFDSIHWNFIIAVLERMRFPGVMIGWIKACICSTRFSIKLNGIVHGYFKGWSGLAPSISKSTGFLCNCDDGFSTWFDTLSIPRGTFPVRFLGVPLISSQICVNDCMPLIDRITSRLNSWATLLLSLTGRVMLIRSVVHAIEAFWGNHFLLPASIHHTIQSMLTRFLWKGNINHKGGAKVAWTSICLPREQGGLDLKNMIDWNRAQIIHHLIKVLTKSSSP